MTRTLLLGAALAFGLATAANAGIAPAPVGKTESLMSKVAEGCGRGHASRLRRHVFDADSCL